MCQDRCVYTELTYAQDMVHQHDLSCAIEWSTKVMSLRKLVMYRTTDLVNESIHK